MEFNSLPLEIHLEIFSYLSVGDVMKVRRVCKLWNGLINSKVKFRQLRCEQDGYSPKDWHDFHLTSESAKCFLDYSRKDPKFSRVRYLDAYLTMSFAKLEDAFDFLNSFKLVEQVNFDCNVNDLDDFAEEDIQTKEFRVNLDRLQKAKFDFPIGFKPHTSVVLDLPHLVHLMVFSLNGLTLKYPERLRTLVIYTLLSGRPDCSKFTGLTVLKTSYDSRQFVSANFIEKLPSLRELHLNYDWFERQEYLSCRVTELPPKAKTQPKIFYFGFEFTVEEMPQDFRLEQTENFARFIAQNRHRSVDRNPFIRSICYNPMASELDDPEMFGVIPRKFPNIYQLHLNGNVADENRLLKFINKFKIRCLTFERTSLSQWFFEQLTEKGQFISELKIREEPTMDIRSGDFDFIFKLESLKYLSFGQIALVPNFVFRLLKELKLIISIICNGLRFEWVQPRCKDTIEIAFAFGRFRYEITTKEVPELMSVLQSRMVADGSVSSKDLQTMLCRLQLEKETHLFWMRMFVYEQRTSICLSREQMRLLNFLRI